MDHRNAKRASVRTVGGQRVGGKTAGTITPNRPVETCESMASGGLDPNEYFKRHCGGRSTPTVLKEIVVALKIESPDSSGGVNSYASIAAQFKRPGPEIFTIIATINSFRAESLQVQAMITAMKLEFIELFKCKYAARNISKGVFLLPLTLLIIVVLLPLIMKLNKSSSKIYASSLETTETRRCNIFSGNWVPYPKGPYYDNGTCPFISDKQNCFIHGRPDRDFLKWRWKPHECELPLFDASLFLKLVRGKSMAFVGDSVGRNQMESLLCLLNSVTHPEDITARYTSKADIYFKWWLYADYNFTLTLLWSPFLVNSTKTYLNDSSFYNSENLYLDEADKAWTSQIENFDYVIFSGGQWFFRPLTFYENGEVVGCQKCPNMTELDFYGYRNAFRTALRTIGNLKGFKGLTFLVTHSPNHFENGVWNKGGGCNRTQPVTSMEEKTKVHPYGLEKLHEIQKEEFTEAEKEARKKGLHFGLIDITDAMLMRPDGHPHKYGHSLDKNVSVNDCVHWCMPGPIDTWNEFLLYMMKTER
ncbi:protein trichome birefringence-like 19 [Gastrolobium bilobum]|uniref:protein trichome birefringence-like 19 n=1 Tax=Gastrolobium bilobum TaxID=150636 RepID=UPI002AB270D0|nr:protein trichome birefringence-like 19 [Gastrolobium bilobum]